MENRLGRLREDYKEFAAELYYLQNGGNILNFKDWYVINQDRDEWLFDIDNIESIYKLPRESELPSSVLILYLKNECYKVYDWACKDGNICCSNTDNKIWVGNEILTFEDLNSIDAPVIRNDQCSSHISNTDRTKRKESGTEFNTKVSISSEGVIVNSNDCSNLLVEQPNLNTNYKKRKITRYCAAQNCLNHEQVLTMFTFPSIKRGLTLNLESLNRCKKWVQNSGNADLLQVSSCSLYRKKYLCSEHFEENCFYNENRQRLLPNSVPTIFGCPKLDDFDMVNFPILSVHEALLLETLGDDNDRKYASDFEDYMKSLTFKTCANCKEISMVSNNDKYKCIHGKNCQDVHSDFNNMDPGLVPPELANLSYVEQQLIAQVHTQLSVYKLKGQQLAYSGNIINFPQNVCTFTRQLPHKLSDLPSILTIRPKNNETTQYIVRPADFHVRSQYVWNALIWLKEKNKFYKDIEISTCNLESLPESGNVYYLMKHFDEESEDLNNETFHLNDENLELSIEDTYIPDFDVPSQDETIRNVFDWPTIERNAINEFKTEGYIAKAFPTLFPYGVADLRDFSRAHEVKPINYYRHLMRYKDLRFAKHAYFRFFAMNPILRWDAINNGNVFVNRHSVLKSLSLDELKKPFRRIQI